MENYTMLLLVVSQEMDGHIHSPRCTRGDQQMPATILSSTKMGGKIMYTHWRKGLMLEDGKDTQHR
jgi:hypothetical protein